MYAATKYIGLLSIAIISTVILALFSIIGKVSGMPMDNDFWIFGKLILCSIDNLINIICLYLQFKFGKKYYDKYCKCLEVCGSRFFFAEDVLKRIEMEASIKTESDGFEV